MPKYRRLDRHLARQVEVPFEAPERPAARESNAWLGVGLSAISTLLSFGLLSLSQTPVLRAFGLTMLVGITVSMLTSPYFCTDR